MGLISYMSLDSLNVLLGEEKKKKNMQILY